MTDVLFYIFAALALASAFLVVANPFSRNPVTSAMFLVLTIVSLAGLFVLLHAYFLAAIQILVYAGAVMVLFLFVIMLLDLKEEEKQRLRHTALLAGLVAVGGLAFIILQTVWLASPGQGAQPLLEGETPALGRALFNAQGNSPGFLLPFELVGLLLLVAMIGAMVLSKKEVK
jgi:NADH-quinone oxidoreductase subunit J